MPNLPQRIEAAIDAAVRDALSVANPASGKYHTPQVATLVRQVLRAAEVDRRELKHIGGAGYVLKDLPYMLSSLAARYGVNVDD